jgi:hypothetical protein
MARIPVEGVERLKAEVSVEQLVAALGSVLLAGVTYWFTKPPASARILKASATAQR